MLRFSHTKKFNKMIMYGEGLVEYEVMYYVQLLIMPV